jgi:phage-related protein
MKPIKFVGTSLRALRDFPVDARQDAGFQLHFIQVGQKPPDWKPMKTVGSGAIEIRIHRNGEWRVVCVAKFESAVYVLHAFKKETQSTRAEDIALARARYGEIESYEKSKRRAGE